jgi:hypothetical protein
VLIFALFVCLFGRASVGCLEGLVCGRAFLDTATLKWAVYIAIQIWKDLTKAQELVLRTAPDHTKNGELVENKNGREFLRNAERDKSGQVWRFVGSSWLILS